MSLNKFILTQSPSWSTINRIGWEVVLIKMDDYYAFKDKLGVSFPAEFYYIYES